MRSKVKHVLIALMTLLSDVARAIASIKLEECSQSNLRDFLVDVPLSNTFLNAAFLG